MRLIALCSAALLGIALGDIGWLANPAPVVFGACVALLGACLAGRHTTGRWLALSACALALGGLRATAVQPTSPPAIERYVGQLIRLDGRLVSPPSVSS